MAGGEGSEPEPPRHGTEEELETMSDLGFVGSDADDDEGDCKVMWEVECSGAPGGDGGFPSGAGDDSAGGDCRRSILVSDPAAFQDVTSKKISSRDEKEPTEAIGLPFSLAIQCEATNDFRNSDIEKQAVCPTINEALYQAFYGSNKCAQQIGLGDPCDKLACLSSPQNISIDNFSDALSRKLCSSAKEWRGSNHLKHQEQTSSHESIEFKSETTINTNGGLADKGILLVKLGNQLEQGMVKALSAKPYNPIFPLSQGIGSCSLSSQQTATVTSPRTSTYIGHSDAKMKVGCQIAKESSHKALYKGKNPYQSIGLYNLHNKFFSSSFQGTNMDNISNTLLGINFVASAEDNAKYKHMKLLGQIDGYKDIDSGLRLNVSDSNSLDVKGNISKVQLDELKVNTLATRPYHSVFSVTPSAKFSTSPQQSNVMNHMLECMEYHPSMVEETDPNKLDIQSKIDCHENNTCYSRSSSIKSGPHNDKYNMINHARSCNRVSGMAGTSLSRSPISSMIQGSSSICYPNMIDHRMGFNPTYQLNSLDVKETSLDEARKLELLVARLHKMKHGKAIASKAQASCSNNEPCVRRGSTKDFVQIIRLHEDFFHAYFFPGDIPTHIMVVLDQCYALGMNMESHYAPNTITLRLAHQNESSNFKRPCVDFTQMHDSNKLSNDNFNDTSFLRLLNCLSKGSHQLIHIKGRVLRFSVDQCGSRFIQQKLPTATNEEKNMVFEEIKHHVSDLVIDVFGNYVVQKVMEDGTLFHKTKIIDRLIASALNLSFHQYGCRVIQRAVEIGVLDQKIQIVKQLKGNIMALIHDQNANHVIQKCIEQIPHQYIQFIFESMYGCIPKLSVHPYGCRVIQRILEYSHDLSMLKIFLSEIIDEVYLLAKDQYGNYVVQHILEHGSSYHRSLVISTFAGRIVTMSLQKFSSNVIEKCLVCGSYEDKQMIINEILSTDGEPQALKVMVNDQYANYVVQKAIEICNEWQCKLMLRRLKAHHGELNPYPYARHIATRLERLIQAGENRRTTPRYSR